MVGTTCRTPPGVGAALAVLAVFLGLCGPCAAATADGSITAGGAALFVDQEKIVEGPVTDAERDASTVRLRLGYPPQALTVALIIGLLSKFPPEPERYYLGKTVRVVGTIRSFRGSVEMVIHDPADIEVADAPRTGSTAADTSVRDDIDALKQRVRELEGQMQRLRPTGAPTP
jgi:hypothetical protein